VAAVTRLEANCELNSAELCLLIFASRVSITVPHREMWPPPRWAIETRFPSPEEFTKA